jgi:hypothetical protein
MWQIFWHSAQLFLKGKLFRDMNQVIRHGVIGVLLGATVLIVLAKFVLPLWLAAIVAGIVSGGAQPYLFKDLKYA